jgi:hypothetical protein
MSVADLMSVLLYGAMTTAMGALFLRAASAPKLLRNGAAAYLAGQLLWLLTFLVMAWAGASVTGLVWSVGVAAVVVWGTLSCKQWREFVSPAAIVLLLVAVISFPQAFYLVGRMPLIDWDARSIWFFHGKAIWVHAGVTPDYFASSHYVWSHTDYPLLLSVQAAVVAILRGTWSEMAVKGFLGLNFLAYFWVLRSVLRERGWPRFESWSVAVLVMGIMLPSYLNGYADNHYAMALMLVALLAFRPAIGSEGAALAGLLAVHALNMKNESADYVVVGLVYWGVLWWCRERRLEWAAVRDSLRSRCGLGLLLLGVLPFLLWVAFKALHGIEGDLHLASRLLHPMDSLVLCVERAPTIFKAMGIVHGRMFTPLLLGVVVALTGWGYLLAHRERKAACVLLTNEERSLWGVLLLTHGLIFVVYGLTPFDVWWHLGTSIDRLILFPVLILVGILIGAAEKVLDYGKMSLSKPSGM